MVADVASYPQFVPFCTGARTPPRALENAMAGRTHVEAELSVGFMAFQESYVSDVESIPYREVKVRSRPVSVKTMRIVQFVVGLRLGEWCTDQVIC